MNGRTCMTMQSLADQNGPVTLAFEGIGTDDCLELDRLLRGLRFKKPLSIELQTTSAADIVFIGIETEKEIGSDAPSRGSGSRSVLIEAVSKSQVVKHTLCLNKPFRAREILNCINTIIDNL